MRHSQSPMEMDLLPAVGTAASIDTDDHSSVDFPRNNESCGDDGVNPESENLIKDVNPTRRGDIRDERYYLSMKLLLPTAAVVLTSAGLAVSIILWFHHWNLGWTLAQYWESGCFLLHEGVKHSDDGSPPQASLAALTISTIADKVVGVTTPALMSLYAFRTAHAWLKEDKSNLPTPLQYGLLVETLGTSGLFALWHTGKYLCRSRDRRRRAPSMLIEVFMVNLAAYGIAHAISATNIWLHASSSATSTINIDSSTFDGFNFDIDVTPCNASANSTTPLISEANLQCIWNLYGGGNGSDHSAGMLVATNNSNLLAPITVHYGNHDKESLAVLINPAIYHNYIDPRTLGARTSCESVNAQCEVANGTTGAIEAFECANVPTGFPPCDISQNCSDVDYPRLYMLTSSDNGTGPFYTPEELIRGGPKLLISGNDTEIQPDGSLSFSSYEIWLQFVWRGLRVRGDSSDAMSQFSPYAMMMAKCSLSFHNVTLNGLGDGDYQAQQEDPVDQGIVDMLSMSTRIGYYQNNLIANMEAIAFSIDDSDFLMASLRQDLGRFAIASAAFMISPVEPGSPDPFVPRSFYGCYPIVPVITLITLLFTHSSFALIICIATSVSRATKVKVSEEAQSVSALELVHVRLTRPMAIAAELFPAIDKKTGGQKAEKSAKRDAEDMFDEMSDDERVIVGEVKDEKTHETVYRLQRTYETSHAKDT